MVQLEEDIKSGLILDRTIELGSRSTARNKHKKNEAMIDFIKKFYKDRINILLTKYIINKYLLRCFLAL